MRRTRKTAPHLGTLLILLTSLGCLSMLLRPSSNRHDMFLVIGGAGFIGSHLVARLIEQGDSVRVFDNFSTGTSKYLDPLGDRVALVRGDLRDKDAVRQAVDGVHVVFHQAALSSV